MFILTVLCFLFIVIHKNDPSLYILHKYFKYYVDYNTMQTILPTYSAYYAEYPDS